MNSVGKTGVRPGPRIHDGAAGYDSFHKRGFGSVICPYGFPSSCTSRVLQFQYQKANVSEAVRVEEILAKQNWGSIGRFCMYYVRMSEDSRGKSLILNVRESQHTR